MSFYPDIDEAPRLTPAFQSRMDRDLIVFSPGIHDFEVVREQEGAWEFPEAWIDGFADDDGKFYTRAEAAKLVMPTAAKRRAAKKLLIDTEELESQGYQAGVRAGVLDEFAEPDTARRINIVAHRNGDFRQVKAHLYRYGDEVLAARDIGGWLGQWTCQGLADAPEILRRVRDGWTYEIPRAELREFLGCGAQLTFPVFGAGPALRETITLRAMVSFPEEMGDAAGVHMEGSLTITRWMEHDSPAHPFTFKAEGERNRFGYAPRIIQYATPGEALVLVQELLASRWVSIGNYTGSTGSTRIVERSAIERLSVWADAMIEAGRLG